jgi:hypothetical protein
MTGPIVALLLLILLLGPCALAGRLHPQPPQRPTRYPRAKGRPRVRDYVGAFLYEEAKRNERR